MRDLASETVLGLLIMLVGFALSAVDFSSVSAVVEAVVVSDVFRDFPSGLRVESGDSLDLPQIP